MCHLRPYRHGTTLNMSGNKSYSNALFKEEVDLRVPSTDNVILETRLFVPQLQQQGNLQRRRETLVILAHPYGPLGGNFNNPVIVSLFTLFASLGFSTLRLNFRGAGESTGKTSYQGQGEIDDILSSYKFVKSRSAANPSQAQVKSVILVGYSYGAISVTGASKHIPDLTATVLVSYPASVSWALTLGNGKKYLEGYKSAPVHTKLLLMGSKDNFSSVSAFESLCSGLGDPKTVVIVDGCDHFWTEFEEGLMGHVRQWISKQEVFNVVTSPVGETGPPSKLVTSPLPKSSISALNPTIHSPTTHPSQQPKSTAVLQGDKKRYSLNDSTLTDRFNPVTDSETTLNSHGSVFSPGVKSVPAQSRTFDNEVSKSVPLGSTQQRPSRPPPPVPGGLK